jgi:hypothetical protein
MVSREATKSRISHMLQQLAAEAGMQIDNFAWSDSLQVDDIQSTQFCQLELSDPIFVAIPKTSLLAGEGAQAGLTEALAMIVAGLQRQISKH